MVETTPSPHQPMSAKEFRDEVNRRGWTYRALAERWNTTESYVSRVAGDESRRQWFDDAIRGLPLRVIESDGADPTRKKVAAIDSSTLVELLTANKVVELDGGTLLSLFKASGAVIATEPRTRTMQPRKPKLPATTKPAQDKAAKAPKPKKP